LADVVSMMRKLLLDAKHWFSARNRRRKADFAIEFGRRHDVASVLLVGVDRDILVATRATPTTNQVERAIAAAFPGAVATGLAETASGWSRYLCADALDLPFCDGEFDLVYSNAVIEHVGQFEEQLAFLREHARVGKHWVFTTPNRLFPVESHTLTIARHMDPSWRPPGHAYTRLLSRSDLVEILPPTARIHGRTFSPTFTVSSS
jgi:SAM-dependent methyltransferase